VPLPKNDERNAAYKISKRRDDDISSVAVGINMVVTNEIIVGCRIAYGGMAATPKRAANAEVALIGNSLTKASFEKAAVALNEDFKPLSDWRGSAEYRMLLAQNLLRRFYLEQASDTPVQLVSA
jgi:xanthine dehydrogenase small subunit